MISYAEAIAQCAEHIAKHDAHGYSQPNRKGYGTEVNSFSDGTTYTIHRGDYDCSEMVRMCVEAAGLLTKDSYMWTGNEDQVLRDAGFYRVYLGDIKRGDILWKTGHTGIYLGSDLMADAHGDEYGGITGPSQGDQTEHEIETRNVWSCNWERAYRAPYGFVAGSSEVSDLDITRGIDVSNWDSDVVLNNINCGFVIAKCSEGNDFTDMLCKSFVIEAFNNKMLYGMYHFADTNDPIEEAEYFVKQAKATGYIDGATLWLDYECDAIHNGPEWAERFMAHVDKLTGKTCGIYMSQSIAVSQDWKNSKSRPLWVAEYAGIDPDGPITNWDENPWSTNNYGAWGTKCAIHQYTGNGHVSGYTGALDLDRGYFTREQWANWASTTDEPIDNQPTDGDYFTMDAKTVTFCDTVNVRDSPSIQANIRAQYSPGESATINGIAIEDGYCWGHYIGSVSGEDRYVALGRTSYIE